MTAAEASANSKTVLAAAAFVDAGADKAARAVSSSYPTLKACNPRAWPPVMDQPSPPARKRCAAPQPWPCSE
eukprot:3933662-Rhodomonas_salina.2